MPWAPGDAARHDKKAKSAVAQRQWSHVANAVLAKTGDDGRAVREANAVIARRSHGLDSVKKFAEGGPVISDAELSNEIEATSSYQNKKKKSSDADAAYNRFRKNQKASEDKGLAPMDPFAPKKETVENYQDAQIRRKESAAGAPTGYAAGGPVNIHGVAMRNRMSMHQQKIARG